MFGCYFPSESSSFHKDREEDLYKNGSESEFQRHKLQNIVSKDSTENSHHFLQELQKGKKSTKKMKSWKPFFLFHLIFR